MLDDKPSYPPEGPFAFPWVTPDHMCPGMNLRDWFAGHALTGSFTKRTDEAITQLAAGDSIYAKRIRAQYAYDIADAMMTERTRAR